LERELDLVFIWRAIPSLRRSQPQRANPAQSLYYENDGDVAADEELQAWWTEIRTKGHPDADPSGWPAACKDGIKTVADLSDITTTMAWMGSAHHAAGISSACRVERLSPSRPVPHPRGLNVPVKSIQL
jgi:hypothetical protein